MIAPNPRSPNELPGDGSCYVPVDCPDCYRVYQYDTCQDTIVEPVDESFIVFNPDAAEGVKPPNGVNEIVVWRCVDCNATICIAVDEENGGTVFVPMPPL